MYSGKHQTTGFNLQIACIPAGDIVAIGPVPVPGSGHDSPARGPPGGELSPKQQANNTVINSFRATVGRAVAHLKNRGMLQTRYRAPPVQFSEALSVIIGLY